VIPCAGIGSRAGSGVPKQYRALAGRSVVAHTVEAFRALSPRWAGLWLVVAPDDRGVESAVPGFPAGAERLLREGGASRAHTVFNALEALRRDGARDLDWVLVHDAARCLVTPAQIEALVAACENDAVGGLLARPVSDTLKSARIRGHAPRVDATLARDDKWLAQTPQMFRLGLLARSLAVALAQGADAITDESGAIEAAGHAPLLVPGSALNFKLTYPEDFALADAVLRGRANERSTP
ncbi:MAG: 2-C-methyl-D-erythritol 4-phosphate cytidylyltransferase, partial [Comamonadaceae bacterium]